MVRTELRRISGNKYQPRCETEESATARRAVAPAGGCIVFVSTMTAEARPTERAPASHCKPSKLGLNSNNLLTQTPMTAERKCPIMELRGCANGLSIVLYSRMAAAPYQTLAACVGRSPSSHAQNYR